jgi:hypothetical protein
MKSEFGFKIFTIYHAESQFLVTEFKIHNYLKA